LLRRLQITAIHVTHDQQEAMAIADRMAVMRAGRVVQVGHAEELYRSPGHPFVASFLGRVNRLPLATIHGAQTPGIQIGDTWLAADRLGRMPKPRSAYVRPEDIGLQAAGDGIGHARVTSRTFLGDRARLVVTDRNGLTLQVDAPRDCPFAASDPILLHIDPERLMIFGEDE
jgi:putative spermidine/putrescine transport system ATP-binding protein